MRNREAVLRKLDGIESNMNKLNFTLNRGNRETSYEIVEEVREQVSQLKMYVETEPITGSEINRV
jgi:archaellum component FlaC